MVIMIICSCSIDLYFIAPAATVIILSFIVEIFSDGTRQKIYYSNIIPVQRLKVEIFSDGYTHLKFIPYKIFSREN